MPEEENRRAISTHAPAGGATSCACFLVVSVFDFYSRPCGRGDLRVQISDDISSIFLLTPLREGRREVVSCQRQIIYFYSRPCGRGDVAREKEVFIRKISTHAPAGGATRNLVDPKITEAISTHAPAGGATNAQKEHIRRGNISTHAPAGGATFTR